MSRARSLRRFLAVGVLAAAFAVPVSPAAAQVTPLPVCPMPSQVPSQVSTLACGSNPVVADGLALEVLTTDAQDPTSIDVAPDGRVFFAERKGAVKIIGSDGEVVTAARIGVDVRANQCTDCPGTSVDEGGLHGLALAPDFADSGHVYAYYSVPNSKGIAPNPPKWPGAGGTQAIEGVFRLSRFTVTGSTLDLSSEVPLLENPAEWDECCHYGGDIDWLPDGTMLLSVADDTNPHASNGYSPRDKTAGREAWDADRTAQNPADRRGKVLRLMPDGSVPTAAKGVAPNPHVGDEAYDPYVYAMGFRSNYRIAVDPATGSTFVGNVGPDASADNPSRGPRGHDEIETIPAGGGTNHGWPHCIGNNTPYYDYDFATQTSGAPLSCEGMVPADIYYPPQASSTWPQLGSGSRTAIAGTVYRYQGDGARKLPDTIQDHFVMMEFSRDRIWTVPAGADGRLDATAVTEIASNLRGPIDAAIGPDGAVYIAEYGTGFYNNTNSRISRLQPEGSEAAPQAAPAGLAPTAAGAGRAVAVLAATSMLVLGAVRRRRAV